MAPPYGRFNASTSFKQQNNAHLNCDKSCNDSPLKKFYLLIFFFQEKYSLCNIVKHFLFPSVLSFFFKSLVWLRLLVSLCLDRWQKVILASWMSEAVLVCHVYTALYIHIKCFYRIHKHTRTPPNISTHTLKHWKPKGFTMLCLCRGFSLMEQKYSHNPQRGAAFMGSRLSITFTCTGASGAWRESEISLSSSVSSPCRNRPFLLHFCSSALLSTKAKSVLM